MSVMPYATVVGVFRNRSAADLAMQALLNAGFKSEQMRCLVADDAGGFLDSLKSVFTGISPEEETLVSNLTGMGLSSDEAQYFSDEYARGSAILAIKTQGDEEMALNILYEYGAQNARERARFSSVMPRPNQSASSTTSNDYAVPVYSGAVSSDAVPSQFQADEARSTQSYQQNEALYDSRVTMPFYQTGPDEPELNPQAHSVATTPRENTTLSPEDVSDNRTEPFPQEVASDLTTPFPQEAVNDPDAPFPQEVTSDPNTPLPQDVPSNPEAPFPPEAVQAPEDQVYEAAPELEETDTVEEVITPAYSDEQINLVNPEVIDVVEIDEIEEDETSAEPTFQTNSNNVHINASELQQLLAQIETTKQQLEEARSQLEEAKTHESQLTTARLQLKELQTELQATQAELQEMHQRIAG